MRRHHPFDLRHGYEENSVINYRVPRRWSSLPVDHSQVRAGHPDTRRIRLPDRPLHRLAYRGNFEKHVLIRPVAETRHIDLPAESAANYTLSGVEGLLRFLGYSADQ